MWVSRVLSSNYSWYHLHKELLGLQPHRRTSRLCERAKLTGGRGTAGSACSLHLHPLCLHCVVLSSFPGGTLSLPWGQPVLTRLTAGPPASQSLPRPCTPQEKKATKPVDTAGLPLWSPVLCTASLPLVWPEGRCWSWQDDSTLWRLWSLHGAVPGLS